MSFLDIPREILDAPPTELPEEPWREFEPNSLAQAQAINSWARLVGYSGRLGSSKSRTCCEGAFFDACFWPRNRVLLTRKRATDLHATTLAILRDEVVPPALWNSADRRFGYRSSAAGAPTLYLPNGSVIMFIGLDEPMKIRSGQYGSIYVDQAEDLDDEERKTAESRLRHRVRPVVMEDGTAVPLRRRIVYAFNPDGDYHWGNAVFRFREMQELPEDHPERWRRVYKTKEPRKLLDGSTVPPGRVLAEAIIARPADNTENLDQDYQLGLTTYVGPWRDRYVRGLWGSFEGQVLPAFSERLHVVDRPGEWDEWGGYPPPTWARFCGIDFGFGPGHPFVFAWYAVRPAQVLPDGRVRPAKWHLYREIYMTGEGHRSLHGVPGIVSEHAKQVLDLEAQELAAVNAGIDRWNRTHSPGEWLAPLEYFPVAIRAADHDAEDRATLDAAGISTYPALKDRLPGAQLVAEMLEPFQDPLTGERDARLVFVRDALVEADPDLENSDKHPPLCTWQELGGIRWLKPKPGSDGIAKEDWVKDRDHGFDQCIAAGSLVRTDRGDVPIEQVEPGDLALTREGFRRVVAAWLTHPAAKTLEVHFSNGAVLRGTPEHRIWTDRGWICIDALRYGDIVTTCEPATLSPIGVCGSIGTARAISTLESDTGSRASKPSTARSGRTKSGPFRAVTTSTTSMATRPTTPFRTWLASPSLSTSRPIARFRPIGYPRCAEGWTTPEPSRQRGTAPTLGAAGTSSKDERSRRTSSPEPWSAFNAPRLSSRSSPRRSSAAILARQWLGAGPASTTSIGPALSAARPSGSTATHATSPARASVLRVIAGADCEPVHDLTVEGAPEFFANGVLVHNCRYALRTATECGSVGVVHIPL